MAEPIDPKEQKLLGDILALVIGDHQGQAESALEMLRRRARQDRVTGGAIKSLFDRISLGDALAHEAVEQLSRTVRQLQLQQAGLQTELAIERRSGVEATELWRLARLRLIVAVPLAAAACLAVGFLAGTVRDAWTGEEPRPPRVSVSPAAAPATDAPGPPRAVVTAGPQPMDAPVLPVEARAAITDHLLACGLIESGRAGPGLPVRVQLDLTSAGVIRGVQVGFIRPAANAGAAEPQQAMREFAGRISQALLAPACATLPLPSALLGRVHTVVFRFAP